MKAITKKIYRKFNAVKGYIKRLEFLKEVGLSHEIEEYKRELKDLGLIDRIIQKQHEFNAIVTSKTSKDHVYGFGGMGLKESVILYGLLRKLKPEIVVETGVCNGVSSTIILQALEKNNKGLLYSIDFPEIEGMVYENGTFWAGKRGAAIPKDKQPGWIIPDKLRNRWHLRLGKSQDILPKLLAELEEIDIFVHDSEHSYECMQFEYSEAFPKLKNNGILISDDIFWNNAFKDFAHQEGIKTYYLSNSVGALLKT